MLTLGSDACHVMCAQLSARLKALNDRANGRRVRVGDDSKS
jgi:hypothetical protein